MQIPDLFCHNTNIQTFFMHVEDSDMNGWIASSKPFDNINIGQQLLIFNRDLRREDVEAAYTENVTAYSVQFPKTRESATDPIWVDGQNIGTLFKYYVYYSGFKKKTNDLDMVVVENFYEDPDFIRDFALNLEYGLQSSHRGYSANSWTLDGTKERFEEILQTNILDWHDERYRNGMFQYITGKDPIVHHVDENNYAGIIYLTPDAPFESGTSFYESKSERRSWFNHDPKDRQSYENAFNDNFYNRHKFTEIDRIGNVYNRLVLWDSFKIHAATQHFGNDLYDSRLFHIFFFDTEGGK
jgi:hypothetical protein